MLKKFTIQHWILFAALIIVIFLVLYLWANRYTPNTRNAYVQAYTVPISSPVSGVVTQVFIRDNEVVHKGQSLFSVTTITHQINTVRAPAPGFATDLYLRPGQYATTGQPLLTFIENHTWWVVANLKETNLSLVKKGQPALISINMYPGKLFHGTVAYIERGVSLSSHPMHGRLPYVASSNDWVRLAQRIPVRINFSHINSKRHPLVVGSSAHVVILTPQSQHFGWLGATWLWFINRLGYL